MDLSYASGIEDQSVYLPFRMGPQHAAGSRGSIEALESFVGKYPHITDVRLVRYSLRCD